MPNGPYGTIEPGDLIGLLTDPGVQNAIRAIVPAGWTLPSTSAVGDAPAAGGFGAWAQVDHRHGRETLASLIASIVPTGLIVAFGGAVAPPGFVLCDGASYATAAQAALFGVIGYTYGGIGANFLVPDRRSRVGVGAGMGGGLTNRILGTTGGEELHTLLVGEMPSHAHTYPNTAGTGGGANIAEGAPNAGTGANINAAGGGGSHNNMQPWLAVSYVIKT